MSGDLARRSVVAGLAAAPMALAAVGADQLSLTRPQCLDQAARGRNRYFGAAVRADQLGLDTALRECVLRECGWITPEIHMKWDQLQPRRGWWTFTAADALVVFAAQNNLRLRGHTLLWHQSTPRWVASALRRRRDWRIVSDHLREVVLRYRDHVAVWDVVNEPLDGRVGRYPRPNVFLSAFGPGYVARALREAAELAPDARLAINEYGFEYVNADEDERRAAFLSLLRQLKAEGAPLHEVGIQAHLDLGKGPTYPEVLKPFLQAIADMGYRISITELDVREREFRLPVRERDRRVADAVRAYLDIVLEVDAVDGVSTWGIADRYSWLQEIAIRGRHGPNRGLPLDWDFRRKPMFWAMRDALNA